MHETAVLLCGVLQYNVISKVISYGFVIWPRTVTFVRKSTANTIVQCPNDNFVNKQQYLYIFKLNLLINRNHASIKESFSVKFLKAFIKKFIFALL